MKWSVEAQVGWRWTPASVSPPPLDRCASPRLYWQLENVKDFWLLSAGVDAIGYLISLDWIAGSGQIGRLVAGAMHPHRGGAPSPNAKRYLRERRSQPTDRRESTLSRSARTRGVGVRHYALDCNQSATVPW